MISSLRGRLLAKSPTEAVLEVHGVGFALGIPLSTYGALGEVGSDVSLFTHLHVREDALLLYGFATEAERESFRLLLSVSGIGPKVAQGILSGITVQDLRMHLAQGNHAALTGIPGVGRKLAERLVVELRERITRSVPAALQPGAPGDEGTCVRSEALRALTSLGYSRPAAERALLAALQEGGGASLEELIKTALRLIAR